MHSWRRFLSALVLAPLAGGLAGFLTGIGFVLFIGKESERNWRDASTLGSFLGVWSLLICLAYVLIIGSAAYSWARLQQRPLSLAVALIVGFVVGVVPFTFISFRKGEGLSREALLFPVLALVCSIATAWTFWRVAIAERAAV